MSPTTLSEYHREERDYLWFDLRARLGDGTSILSATATVSIQQASGGWEDMTEAFGEPAVEVNPAATVDEAGEAVGGAGWIRVGPLAPGEQAPGIYAVKVDAALSDARHRVETVYLPIVDTGDPE